MIYTRQEQTTFSITRRVMYSIGLACSMAVLWLSVGKRRQGLYHRLHIAIACHLIVDACWSIVGQAAVPVETGVTGAAGTTVTCSAQGFFNQIGLTVWFYYIALSVYGYVAVTNNCHPRNNNRHVEWWIHIIVHIYPLVTAIYVLCVEGFNYTGGGLGCYVASIPEGCGTGTGIECERGPQNIRTVKMVVVGVPVLFFIVFPTIVLTALYCHQKRQQKRSDEGGTDERIVMNATRDNNNYVNNDKDLGVNSSEESNNHETQEENCKNKKSKSTSLDDTNSAITCSILKREKTKADMLDRKNRLQVNVEDQLPKRDEGAGTDDVEEEDDHTGSCRQRSRRRRSHKTRQDKRRRPTIDGSVVLRQGSLYLLVVYWSFILVIVDQAMTKFHATQNFVLSFLAMMNLSLQGCWILLIYVWNNKRLHDESLYCSSSSTIKNSREQKIRNSKHNSRSRQEQKSSISRNGDGPKTDTGCESSTQTTSTVPTTTASIPSSSNFSGSSSKYYYCVSSELLSAAAAAAAEFNIFDGTNASGAFSEYVYSDDDDDDEDEKEVNIFDHNVDDQDDDPDIESSSDFDDHPCRQQQQQQQQEQEQQFGYGRGEDKRDSIYWKTIQDHV